MTKARKVKVASRPAKAPQRIRRTARPSTPAPSKAKPREAPEAREGHGKEGDAARGLPKGLARAALLAAAAASDEEPEVVARPAPKKGGGGVEWEDFEDDEESKPSKAPPKGTAHPPAPLSLPPPAAEGVEVVARGPSKFSTADIEALRSAIKVKGAASVVDGINLEELRWDAEGLLSVVAQDRRTGAVLSLGSTNRETLEKSLRSRQMVYWSREHQKEQAGDHPQRLHKALVDCDKDAILALVEQEGPACVQGTATCWVDGRSIPLAGFLGQLDAHLGALAKQPDGSGTAKQLGEPLAALRRFVEDANEVSKSVQGKTGAVSLEHAAADLLHSLLVACRSKGVGLEKLVNGLYARHLASQAKTG